MFVNTITDFLYKEIEDQHRDGKFDDVQYAYLNSMIDDIGYLTNIVMITSSVNDFGEKFEEYGGDVARFEKNFKNYARSTPKLRVAQRLGHAVIKSGKSVMEVKELIKRRMNIPHDDKINDKDVI